MNVMSPHLKLYELPYFHVVMMLKAMILSPKSALSRTSHQSGKTFLLNSLPKLKGYRCQICSVGIRSVK